VPSRMEKPGGLDAMTVGLCRILVLLFDLDRRKTSLSDKEDCDDEAEDARRWRCI